MSDSVKIGKFAQTLKFGVVCGEVKANFENDYKHHFIEFDIKDFDLSALIVVGSNKKIITDVLLWKPLAYITTDVELPKNCKEVFSSEGWIRMYDCEKCIFSAIAQNIKIFEQKENYIIQIKKPLMK